MDEKRSREIAAMWRTTTESGVTVDPMRAAVEAMENLGADMREARELLRDGEALHAAKSWGRLAMVTARIQAEIAATLPLVRADEPAAWAEYVSRLRPAPPSQPSRLPRTELASRVRGAWVGQCIGTALGDPVEGWTSDEIRACYGQVRGYLAPPKVENDDTAYPLLVLHALDEYGPEFTSTDLALEWVAHLPLAYTAEWAAIENVKAGIFPPESRWPRNPCGAWVGGQMRTSVHGLLAPLEPRRASELAFRDARISHFREGMDGAIYAAALASLAFSGRRADELVREALLAVPPDRPFAAAVEQSLEACRRRGDVRGAMEALRPDLARYHWIHTIPNIACVVVGLVLGDGDFERAILATLECGYDADCTTGQVGAVMGILVGAEAIPERWSGPIGGALRSYVDEFEAIDFDDLVAWTLRSSEHLAAADPGRRGSARGEGER